ncbi:MAG: hypothetical protein Q4G65_10115 [bacterium]|nr:hypothetical protein [bacterium]
MLAMRFERWPVLRLRSLSAASRSRGLDCATLDLPTDTDATPRTLDAAKLVAQLKAQNVFLG